MKLHINKEKKEIFTLTRNSVNKIAKIDTFGNKIDKNGNEDAYNNALSSTLIIF